MKFGLKFVDSCIVELIDMETAEILAEGPAAVQEWLTVYDGNYTLTLVQECFFYWHEFCAPRSDVRGENFHYNTGFNFCQEKIEKKIKKLFFTKRVDKHLEIGYN